MGLRSKISVLVVAGWCVAAPSRAQVRVLSERAYFDKTAGCVAGQIAGFLSGYEFVGGRDNPRIGLPDAWFTLCGGPYAGGKLRGSAGENFITPDGRISLDDDYHIDFFNQLILEKHGVDAVGFQIAQMWRRHQVRDWGGGAKAMSIINREGYFPPFTGRLEYGNTLGWCTEAYIETETIGCVFPGMPARAARTAGRFASNTGDFDPWELGRFYAVAYSLAYFERDAAEALRKAMTVMPAGSWARRICQQAFDLHTRYPDDWRRAAREIHAMRRGIFLMDNPQTAYDVNAGFTILSVLYGGNDFLETVRIASLIGYDGDCTAATAGGLLGIVHGVKSLPRRVHEVVWRDGKAIIYNNPKLVPRITKDYPQEQTIESIVRLYQRNAVRGIESGGGRAEKGKYHIVTEEVPVRRDVWIDNADFERGTPNLSFETTGSAAATAGNFAAAHNGKSSARVTVNRKGDSGRVMFDVEGLTVGGSYRLSAYLMTDPGCEAKLFVRGAETPYTYTSTLGNDSLWVYRTLVFTARDTKLQVGLRGDFLSRPGGAYLDDLMLEECPEVIETTFRENSFVVPAGGVRTLRVHYRNTAAGMLKSTLHVDGKQVGELGFPPTGDDPPEAAHTIEFEVAAGTKIEIKGHPADVTITKIKLINASE